MSLNPDLPIRSHAASDALGLWEPKRTLTLAAARKHTQRIAFLRRMLIGASGALVALLIYYFVTQSNEQVIEDDPDTSVRMINPRYSGRTSDNLPFYLTSDSATRQLESRTEVALVKPVLEFIRADGAESSFVEADGGTYDDVNKILNLRTDLTKPESERQNVVLETDDGYRCVTSHARIFAREKRIIGDEPITCVGNFGTVNGNAYEILDNYRNFIFKDGMDGIINRDSDNAAGLRGTPERGAAIARPIFGFDGDGPINVSANQATYVGGTTDLAGNVIVVQDGSTIYSNDMTILRDQADSPAAAAGTIRLGAVREIIAVGDFRYVSEDNDVRGDKGVYERDKSLMTVTGKVTVVQPGGNTVSTDRLVYDTVTETIRFSGQCQGRDCGTDDRTRIVIEN
ncbi:LPS export ABC transporter periplasmic protein LptC [Algimonas arctica]|nr:LPS export ABC transporter periplasmic protein LptC [Algimonas arctica]